MPKRQRQLCNEKDKNDNDISNPGLHEPIFKKQKLQAPQQALRGLQAAKVLVGVPSTT